MAADTALLLFSRMKKLMLLLLCFIVMTSCTKSTSSSNNPGDKKILKASFFYPSGFEETDGVVIDEANKRIIIHPAFSNSDTNVFRIKFTLSDQAQAVPASESTFDLSSPKTIDVTAADGSKQTYTIIRSLIAMQAYAYDEAGSSTEFLLLNKVREIRASGSAIRMTFGHTQHDANHNITGSKLDLTINDALSGNMIKTGTYDGATKCAATLEWSRSYFFFGPINSGKIIIEKYDPVLKICSGRIEDLTHILMMKNGIVSRSLSVSGRFVNIPYL